MAKPVSKKKIVQCPVRERLLYSFAVFRLIIKGQNYTVIAVYTRVSTQEQSEKGWSLPAQAKVCRGLIESVLGKKSVLVFADTATGQNLDRPGLKSFLQAVEGKHRSPSYLFCWRPDRLSRSQSDFWILLKKIEEAGFLVRFCEPWIEAEHPEGRMLLGVLASVAEFEISTLCARTRLGQQKAKSEGVHCGGAGYGSRHNPEGKLILDESEQQILHEILGLWKSGESYRSIARRLNDKKIKRKRGGKQWYASTIKSVIDNSQKILNLVQSAQKILTG